MLVIAPEYFSFVTTENRNNHFEVVLKFQLYSKTVPSSICSGLRLMCSILGSFTGSQISGFTTSCQRSLSSVLVIKFGRACATDMQLIALVMFPLKHNTLAVVVIVIKIYLLNVSSKTTNHKHSKCQVPQLFSSLAVFSSFSNVSLLNNSLIGVFCKFMFLFVIVCQKCIVHLTRRKSQHSVIFANAVPELT